jgi:thiamine biosynthesis lipoprotein ApbE
VDADLRELRQAEAKAVEQLVTFKDALLKTTTAQEVQDQRVHQLAQQTRASSRQECAQIVVRAPQGTTCNQVATALAQCLPCEPSGVQVRLVTNK